MSEFKSQCGCEIHVIQWSSKRKIASVKYCQRHKAGDTGIALAKSVLRYFEEDELSNSEALKLESQITFVARELATIP